MGVKPPIKAPFKPAPSPSPPLLYPTAPLCVSRNLPPFPYQLSSRGVCRRLQEGESVAGPGSCGTPRTRKSWPVQAGPVAITAPTVPRPSPFVCFGTISKHPYETRTKREGRGGERDRALQGRRGGLMIARTFPYSIPPRPHHRPYPRPAPTRRPQRYRLRVSNTNAQPASYPPVRTQNEVSSQFLNPLLRLNIVTARVPNRGMY